MLSLMSGDIVTELLQKRKDLLIALLKDGKLDHNQRYNFALELSDINSALREVRDIQEKEPKHLPEWLAESY